MRRRGTVRGAIFAISSRQIGIAEALATGAVHDAGHLMLGIERAMVMPALELAHLAVQVLVAHVVIGTVVAALEQRLEGFQIVGARGSVRVFAA